MRSDRECVVLTITNPAIGSKVPVDISPYNARSLQCRLCGNFGSATLIQIEGDDMPTATVSDCFQVVQCEYGPTFQCVACGVKEK
jgi:hypothetical protein